MPNGPKQGGAKKGIVSKITGRPAVAGRAAEQAARPPQRLSGGNPQIAKDYGDAPVQAHIDAMPGWQRDLGRRLDALIARAVPGVAKAVKWNSPLYGIEGQGRFVGIHCFTHYVKVAFFRGVRLRPLPPGASKTPDTRYLDIRQVDRFHEGPFVEWVRQGSRLPGERMRDSAGTAAPSRASAAASGANDTPGAACMRRRFADRDCGRA